MIDYPFQRLEFHFLRELMFKQPITMFLIFSSRKFFSSILQSVPLFEEFRF